MFYEEDEQKVFTLKPKPWYNNFMENNIRLGFNGGRKATLADLQNEVKPGWADLIKRLVEDLFTLGWDASL